MSKLGKVTVVKDEKDVSRELKSTYGSTIVLMTSNPEEIKHIFDLVKDDYDVVMDTTLIDNGDYAKVIVRKELNNASSDIHTR